MSKQVQAFKGDLTKINAEKMSAITGTLDKACGRGWTPDWDRRVVWSTLADGAFSRAVLPCLPARPVSKERPRDQHHPPSSGLRCV